MRISLYKERDHGAKRLTPSLPVHWINMHDDDENDLVVPRASSMRRKFVIEQEGLQAVSKKDTCGFHVHVLGFQGAIKSSRQVYDDLIPFLGILASFYLLSRRSQVGKPWDRVYTP